MQKADHVTAGRTESRTLRHVGHRRHLDAFGYAHSAKRLAPQLMAQFIETRNLFRLAVFKPDQVVNRRARERNMHIKINGGGKNKTPVPGIVRREIGRSPAKRYAKRSTNNYHRQIQLLLWLYHYRISSISFSAYLVNPVIAAFRPWLLSSRFAT